MRKYAISALAVLGGCAQPHMSVLESPVSHDLLLEVAGERVVEAPAVVYSALTSGPGCVTSWALHIAADGAVIHLVFPAPGDVGEPVDVIDEESDLANAGPVTWKAAEGVRGLFGGEASVLARSEEDVEIAVEGGSVCTVTHLNASDTSECAPITDGTIRLVSMGVERSALDGSCRDGAPPGEGMHEELCLPYGPTFACSD